MARGFLGKGGLVGLAMLLLFAPRAQAYILSYQTPDGSVDKDGDPVKAKADIKAIEEAANMFKLDNGFYPTTAEGLTALVQAPPRAKR